MEEILEQLKIMNENHNRYYLEWVGNQSIHRYIKRMQKENHSMYCGNIDTNNKEIDLTTAASSIFKYIKTLEDIISEKEKEEINKKWNK